MADRGENPESQFEARADNAALALRQSLIGQGRQMPDRASVAVGPDGRPPAPPPPEGSYMRQMIEQQQRQEPPPQQPAPAQTPRAEDMAAEAQQSPPQPEPQEPSDESFSGNANRRIKDLIDELRQKDQELQQTIASSKQKEESYAQLEARLNALQQQHEQLVESNLDRLDPETRMQVMQDARVQEMVANMERRILGQLQPHLQRFEESSARSEMERLASTYPAFDIEVHGPLIERFRRKNPACSIRQAFHAIAEPEELRTTTASAAVVPPVVPPGNVRTSHQRFAPQQERQSDPEAELIDEAQRLKKLMREGSPEERKDADRMWHEHLKRRLTR